MGKMFKGKITILAGTTKPTEVEVNADGLYSTSEEAMKFAEIQGRRENRRGRQFVKAGFEEVEVLDNTVLEGKVTDNGCQYEDYAVFVGDQAIESFFDKNYNGRKVRITVEVIE